MPDTKSQPIDGDNLLQKSKEYISRALKSRAAGDQVEYHLWAAFALELLGKAVLANQHPCLIVDPNHQGSLFAAAGIRITTDVKTISARTVFTRLAKLVPMFDSSVRQFCMTMAERRNSELHSADVSMKTVSRDSWDEKYWYACKLILKSMNLSLEQWIGKTEQSGNISQILDRGILENYRAVRRLIDEAEQAISQISEEELKQRIAAVDLLEPHQLKDLFIGTYDEVWKKPCPACEHIAFVAGIQIKEEILPQEEEGWPTFEQVERDFIAEALHCPICHLILSDSSSIRTAGVKLIHNDQIERPIDYSPEYGND